MMVRGSDLIVLLTGAHTVKLNLMSDCILMLLSPSLRLFLSLNEDIGSELMARGDRFSFTGDAHAAQAAALVAFEDYSFIKNNIDRYFNPTIFMIVLFLNLLIELHTMTMGTQATRFTGS